jgi:hypothetical protein
MKINYKGFDFEVNQEGQVKTKDCTKFRKTQLNSSGYPSFSHKNKIILVHRLIALAFVANPLDKKFVNHKDGNKLNNHYTNLEWVTQSENELHSVRVLGNKRNTLGLIANQQNNINKRKVNCFDVNGNFISQFNSCADAARFAKVVPTSVNNQLKGITKTSGGYIFKYI